MCSREFGQLAIGWGPGKAWKAFDVGVVELLSSLFGVDVPLLEFDDPLQYIEQLPAADVVVDPLRGDEPFEIASGRASTKGSKLVKPSDDGALDV